MRVTPWLRAAKYIDTVKNQMLKPNGWAVAEYAGGPSTGPNPAAAQPGHVGHLRGDEPGTPVRGGAPGGGGQARPPGGVVIGALVQSPAGKQVRPPLSAARFGVSPITGTLVNMGSRKWSRWPLWAVAGITVIVAVVLCVVWRSGHRDSYATYGAFAVEAVALVSGMYGWARRKSSNAADRESLDRAVEEDLATAVLDQWERAAGERGLTGANPIQVTWASPSLAVAGPAEAAVNSHRFTPLPGLKPAGPARLASGHVNNLHALYGGLGSGRLIIIGAPGSGKSGAAVLLILAALRYRDQASAEDRPDFRAGAGHRPGLEPRQRIRPQLAGQADAHDLPATARTSPNQAVLKRPDGRREDRSTHRRAR